ncbi:MAG: hypothetical protein ACT4RN_01750 [Pseudonocardia sp.]
MTTPQWEAELARLVWSAQTPGDVERVLKIAEDKYGTKAVSVGRDNNIGTIRMASDPGLALVERITNGIDGHLELAMRLNPGAEPRSPEEAAAAYFGLPEDRLAGMTETDRRRLASHLIVSMHESGLAKRPTVRVEDHGIGQHPNDFGTTLLSLNESNKVGKPFTMGTYGQGGSVTLGFSEWTVFVSRRHPKLLGDQQDLVGWTVAFEEATDPVKNVLPRYVWLVRPDGTPFTLPPALIPELAHGTRITHVRYDVQSLTGPYTTQMWQFLHGALFDPVLPFLLTGDRKNDPRKTSGAVDDRVIIGNAARLANVDKARSDLALGAYDSHDIDLGPEYGSVEISWWALVRPEASTSKTDPAASYVQAGNAVSLTLHGQRQDAERRSWIKDKALLPHLYKNMVVHIDANGLRPIGRRELFASTRERATESELRRLIYGTLADLLKTDPELKRLNHAEKEKLLRRSTSATNEKIRKRLGKFIKTRLKGVTKPGGPKSGDGTIGGGTGSASTGSVKGKTKNPGDPSPNNRNLDDTHLPHVPTEIRFESKAMRIVQGFSGYVWVAVNAKNGYLPAHDDSLSIAFGEASGDNLHIQSRSKLLGGRARWRIQATSDTPLGEHGMTVELMTANGLLTAALPIVVVAPPEPDKQPDGGTDDETGPDVRWITADMFEEMQVDQHTVGRVDEDDESTIIWVNRDFTGLARALNSSKLTAEVVQTRADRYQFPVACGLWLQHHELKTTDPQPEEPWLRAELQRLADAVLSTMMPDSDAASVEGED